jgi:hypothetical protein
MASPEAVSVRLPRVEEHAAVNAAEDARSCLRVGMLVRKDATRAEQLHWIQVLGPADDKFLYPPEV